MKQFEKHLSVIQEKYKRDPDTFFLNTEFDISEYDLAFLDALELIQKTLYGDDKFIIKLTDKGFTYFHDKTQSRNAFWKNHFVNFLFGFVSGLLVGIIGALITTKLLS